MSFFDVVNIAGSGMNAQMVRMNAISSNLGVSASSEQEAYKTKRTVFRTVYDDFSEVYKAGVKVESVVPTGEANDKRFDPHNPMANEEGYVYISNVNSIEEMMEMQIATRAYQSQVEVVNAAKKLVQSTLRLGQ
jgi:flagellar basal-body rod protein FlgC